MENTAPIRSTTAMPKSSFIWAEVKSTSVHTSTSLQGKRSAQTGAREQSEALTKPNRRAVSLGSRRAIIQWSLNRSTWKPLENFPSPSRTFFSSSRISSPLIMRPGPDFSFFFFFLSRFGFFSFGGFCSFSGSAFFSSFGFEALRG